MRLLITTLFIFLLTACGQKSNSNADAVMSAEMPSVPMSVTPKMVAESRLPNVGEQALTEVSEPSTELAQSELKRYIALRHNLAVETPADEMQLAFDATLQQCEALKCQVLSAGFNRQTEYNPPSANIALRIPPRSLSIFLQGLATHSDLLEHHRESEDKTDAVIDAEAHIKNLTELRDRLREMLRQRTGALKDIIEVERELANTQAQLETVLGQRKMLAQETEMVAVSIEFRAKQSITETGFFAPVLKAINEAGRVMMESLANVITFIVAALPWMLLGISFLFLIRRMWRWLKSKNK